MTAIRTMLILMLIMQPVFSSISALAADACQHVEQSTDDGADAAASTHLGHNKAATSQESEDTMHNCCSGDGSSTCLSHCPGMPGNALPTHFISIKPAAKPQLRVAAAVSFHEFTPALFRKPPIA